jgi:hypothetical protein
MSLNENIHFKPVSVGLSGGTLKSESVHQAPLNLTENKNIGHFFANQKFEIRLFQPDKNSR